MGFCDRHVDSPRHKPLPTECAFCSNGQVLRRDQAVFSVLTGLREAMGMPTYPEMDRVRKFEAGQDVWVRGDDGRPYLVQDANATAARLVWHDSKKGGGFTRLD